MIILSGKIGETITGHSLVMQLVGSAHISPQALILTWLPIPVNSHIIGSLEHKEVQHIRHVMVLDGEGVRGQPPHAWFKDPQLEAAEARRLDFILHTNDLDKLLVLKRT